MAKVLSSKSVTFVRGGSHKMVGKQSSGTAKPFKIVNTGGSGRFAKGGGHKMVGKQSSTPAKPC